MKKVVFCAVLLILVGCCVTLTAPADFQAEPVENVTRQDIVQMLEFVKLAIKDAASFEQAIVDLELVLAQKNVIKALQSDNEHKSNLRYLNLPKQISDLLEKIFEATRKEGLPGFEHKLAVAKLLVSVHSLLPKTAELQRHNLETKSNLLFDEVYASKPAIELLVESIVAPEKQPAALQTPTPAASKSQPVEENYSRAKTRSGPKMRAFNEKRTVRPAVQAPDNTAASRKTPRRQMTKYSSQQVERAESVANNVSSATKRSRARNRNERMTETTASDTALKPKNRTPREHGLARPKNESAATSGAVKKAEEKKKNRLAREGGTSKPTAKPVRPSTGNFRSGVLN